MSQYQTLVDVTNGSATVTVTDVDATGEISTGDYFAVNGDGVHYQVASAPSYTSPDTTVTLSAAYQGTTATDVQGLFTRDFTSGGIPILSRGDLETASLMGRLAVVVQDILDTKT